MSVKIGNVNICQAHSEPNPDDIHWEERVERQQNELFRHQAKLF